MIRTQASAAIVARLSRWLAAQYADSIFQVAHIHNLATDSHSSHSLRLNLTK